MHKCPSCQGDVPGVMTQATLEDRVGKVSTAKKLVEDELKALKASASENAPLLAQLAELQGQLDGRARGDSLRAIGVTDSGKREVFEIMFDSHKASNPEATWDGWMEGEEGARANTMLAECFTAEPPPAVPPATPPALSALPPANKGNPASPPGPDPKPARDQLTSYFESAAYKALSPDDQRAKVAELQTQHTATA